MKKIKHIISAIFFVALLLNGCVMRRFPNEIDAQKVDMVFNQDVFRRGGKAVIILQEKNDIPADIDLHGQLTFRDFEGKKYFLDVFGTSVFMLNPGIYKLENFKLCGNSGYWSTQIDYDKRYKAYFKISAGEVVYLGKLETQILLDQTPKEQKSLRRKEIVTVTKIKDEISSLPPAFLRAIQKYTKVPTTLRIMSWRDSFEKEAKK